MKITMPARILDRNVGGNTTYARNIARGLYERGVEVNRIPVGKHPVHTAILETLEALRPPTRDRVIHFVADTGPVVATKGPSLVTVHGVASRWISTARTSRQEYVWRKRVAAAIRNTNKVITVSESSADDISAVFNVPRDRITVIHHGIDGTAFNTATALSDELAQKLPNEFALYLGNVEPRKNLVELVEAINANATSSTAIPLVIAGRQAWNYHESMRVISDSPNVIYLGFVNDEDRRALMQKCRIFVFPSLYEGFGFPILEAMAAGAPVLTTDKGSLAEVCGPANIIKGTDRHSIQHALSSALVDQKWLDRAPAEGRAWAGRFSWDKSVNAHMDAYRELLR
ncbi:glycosyltransferase family 4 protein [Arthrobacter sp. SD76]|uniref:glycosyltransferase family 4 protein n=1 Tax=Arthrobacter sp. SD76 TaxID=3415007 RepID=UPI003C722337